MRLRALIVTSGIGALAVAALAWACLPDLEIAPPPVGLDASCGDGVITPAAGEQCDPGVFDAGGLCVGCQVVCPEDAGRFPDPATNHCYYALGNAQHDDAGALCDESRAHLVRFVSNEEFSLVAAAARTRFWVGLQRATLDAGEWSPAATTAEPGWSGACPGCFAHIDAGATEIPTMVKLPVRCVTAQPGGAETPPWYQSACTDTNTVVCEREPIGSRTFSCKPNACFTVAATQTSKTYVLSPQSTTASGAAKACAALDAGLVVFGSREEREQVGYEVGSEAVLATGTTDFWIGLARGDAGVWHWDRPDAGLQPPPWGVADGDIAEPDPAATPLARAYVVVENGRVDSELAHAQTSANETHYAICEIE